MSISLLERSTAAVLSTFAGAEVKRVAVGAIIVRSLERGSEILVLRRHPHEEYGAIEELPSGIVEEGESLADATRREVAEETSIILNSIDRYAFSFVYPSIKGLTVQLNFAATVSYDVPILLNDKEHTAWRW